MNERQFKTVYAVSKVICLSIVAIISSEFLIGLSGALWIRYGIELNDGDYTAILCTYRTTICLDAFINALVIYLQFPFSKRYYSVFCGFGHRWINKFAVYRVEQKLISLSVTDKYEKM